MLNLQLATEKDRREAALIERRRAKEEERKKRIFNARQRLFGIDYDFLQKQIVEKQQRDAELARVEKIFDEQRKKHDEVALAMEKKEKQERIKLEQEINYFRMCCQRPENRREFDLNDPNLRKKEAPVRDGDDSKLGPSAAQVFEGEDLQSADRAKMQQDQMKAWLDQQMKEKEAAEKERKAAEEAYLEALVNRDNRALQLDRLERECRKRLEDACLKFNKALADERKMAEMRRLKQEHEDSLAEMYNFMTSDLLTEDPEAAQSNLGPGRKVGYMYKGMSLEEKMKIKEYQMAQIEEMKMRKDFEKRRDREFDDFLNGTQRTIALMDKEQERKQRETVRQLVEENRKLAVEQKMRKEFFDKVVYTNRPTEEFYDQFNKSTR